MKTITVICSILCTVLIISCDNHEDPYLLNPPQADSSRARVVNLNPNTAIDFTVGSSVLSTNLPTNQIGAYTRILFNDRVMISINRIASPVRKDTFPDQTIAKASYLTYFVYPKGDTANFYSAHQFNKQDSLDLESRGVARIVFINGVSNSAFTVKSGCQSGNAIITNINFGSSISFDTSAADLSLYLFNSTDSTLKTTARLRPTRGTVTYLIATSGSSGIELDTLSAIGTTVGKLPTAQPETRTTAPVSLLNAVSDGSTISATIQGSSQPIASGIQSLQVSAPNDIPVCTNPMGDSIVVSPSGGSPVTSSIRLTVGQPALVIAYDRSAQAKSAVLGLGANIQRNSGKTYLRGINVSTLLPSASVVVAAGGPAGVSEGYRPFGTLNLGNSTSFVELPAGYYPLILNNGSNGSFISGGSQTFTEGFFTVFIIDNNGKPSMMVLRDDASVLSLQALSQQLQRIQLFSLLPDTTALFNLGGTSPEPVFYSYVISAALPVSTTMVSSNAGQIGVDLSSGSYLVGATGVGTSRSMIAVKSSTDSVPFGRGLVRFINALPNVPSFSVHLSEVSTTPMVPSVATGDASSSIPEEQRKYSFIITLPNDTAVIARVDGVEIIVGRRYALIVGQNKQGSTSTLKYNTLWMQE